MACASDAELENFCQMVRVDMGQSKEETCRAVLAKIQKKRSCMRKPQLQKFARYLGTSEEGTVQQIIDHIAAQLSGDGTEIEESMETEETKYPERPDVSVLAESAQGNRVGGVVSANTGPCITYRSRDGQARYMVIVRVPPDKLNRDKAWAPDGGRLTSLGYPPCQNCGFYFSTGTSNEVNFPDMWFPFMRVCTKDPIKKSKSNPKHFGYIVKAIGLDGGPILAHLQKQFGIDFQNPQISQFYEKFFEKFSHWWQVQISAALPSGPRCPWYTYPELIKLRVIALTYEYDAYPPKFTPSNRVVTMYNVPDCSGNVSSDPNEIHEWLVSNKALCELRDCE